MHFCCVKSLSIIGPSTLFLPLNCMYLDIPPLSSQVGTLHRGEGVGWNRWAKHYIHVSCATANLFSDMRALAATRLSTISYKAEASSLHAREHSYENAARTAH